jgi:hypothetical protein
MHRYSIAVTILLLGAHLTFAGEPAPSVRAFYFGNSLTGCTNPNWHEDLGKSAGRQWQNWAWLGAGWQLWQHREELAAGKDLFGAGSKDDLTIDENLIKSAPFHAKKFFEQPWNAVVLQLFGNFLTHETDELWGRKFSSKRDVGDLGAASDLIRLFLKLNPQGRVFLYQVWPPMDSGEVPPPDKLPDWAKLPGARLAAAEFPKRDRFHYEARWMQPYDPKTDKPWIAHVNRTQDFSYQVFRGLQQRFPELCKAGRLRMIPTGDLFLELDKRMRAGRVPGCRDIRDFYTDIQHIRFGLPRYTAAAMFYACLFESPPDKLDWTLYNDRGKYGDDRYHDGGDLLPITPENVKAVNEAVWQMVFEHPFTGLKKGE